MIVMAPKVRSDFDAPDALSAIAMMVMADALGVFTQPGNMALHGGVSVLQKCSANQNPQPKSLDLNLAKRGSGVNKMERRGLQAVGSVCRKQKKLLLSIYLTRASVETAGIELESLPLVNLCNISRNNIRKYYPVYPFFIAKFNILLRGRTPFRTCLGQGF
jgi:hypothetical protein